MAWCCARTDHDYDALLLLRKVKRRSTAMVAHALGLGLIRRWRASIAVDLVAYVKIQTNADCVYTPARDCTRSV